ncbi:MAG: hypothetical protein IJR99_03215 [Kiritimatiellae bacterium]|nr:hypothetical protein [Kiritimatiellia bacterium]
MTAYTRTFSPLLAILFPFFLTAADSDTHRALFREKARLSSTCKKVETLDPTLSSRELFSQAFQICEAGTGLQQLDLLFDTAEKMQDRNEKSNGFGNFRWTWRDGYVMDYNAVEFCMEHGILIWIRHRDKLTEGQRAKLLRLYEFAIQGCLRHRVSPGYTNIAIMNAANLILLGEALDRPEVFKEGEKRLGAFLLRTAKWGVTEYASPTYTGVDIGTLQTLWQHVKSESVKLRIDRLLTLFWSDVAASTFKQANRFTGAHSRDYDYLYGFGILESYMQTVGLVQTPENHPPRPPVSMLVSDWRPSPETLALADVTPRLIEQSWGEESARFRSLWIGSHVSLSIAGSCYHNMDIPLTADFASTPRDPRVYFIADGRRDPYGRKPIPEGNGPHKKTLHLRPFWAGAQRNRDALGMVLYRPQDVPNGTPTLESHLVFPTAVDEVLLGGRAIGHKDRKRFVMPVQEGEMLIVRSGGGAIGVRVPWSRTMDGKPAQAALIRDIDEAFRLTIAHHDLFGNEMPRTQPPGAAFWVRACDNADDATAFATWVKTFQRATMRAEMSETRVEIHVAGEDGELMVAATEPYGSEATRITPLPEKKVLAINGKDIGREILQDLPEVKADREAEKKREKQLDQNTIRVSATDPVRWEAEAAALVGEMVAGNEDAAFGGKFIWGPGEPGGRGHASGTATWQLDVREAGRYYLWGRFLAPTPEDDSFSLSIQQGDTVILPKTDWHVNRTKGFWEWSPFPSKSLTAIELPKGKLRIQLHIREDGTKADRFFLTPHPNEEPQE